MNKKKVILLIIFIFMLIMPFNVKAADISYGSCIEKKAISVISDNIEVNHIVNLLSVQNKLNENLILTQSPSNSLVCDSAITDTIKYYWRYVVILAPILLIVMCTMDFMKAVMSNDSDSIQKSSSNAFKRAIAMVILLFLPTILSILFTWVGLREALCF